LIQLKSNRPENSPPRVEREPEQKKIEKKVCATETSARGVTKTHETPPYPEQREQCEVPSYYIEKKKKVMAAFPDFWSGWIKRRTFTRQKKRREHMPEIRPERGDQPQGI